MGILMIGHLNWQVQWGSLVEAMGISYTAITSMSVIKKSVQVAYTLGQLKKAYE